MPLAICLLARFHNLRSISNRRFFIIWAERGTKSRVITPGPYADEPVYRLTIQAQQGCNTHPSTGFGQSSEIPQMGMRRSERFGDCCDATESR